MSRDGLMFLAVALRVPRASGDEPFRKKLLSEQAACSPRERG